MLAPWSVLLLWKPAFRSIILCCTLAVATETLAHPYQSVRNIKQGQTCQMGLVSRGSAFRVGSTCSQGVRHQAQAWPASRPGSPFCRRHCGAPGWTARPAPPTGHPSPYTGTAASRQEHKAFAHKGCVLLSFSRRCCQLAATSVSVPGLRHEMAPRVCIQLLTSQASQGVEMWSGSHLTWSDPVPKLSSPHSEQRLSSMRLPKNFLPGQSHNHTGYLHACPLAHLLFMIHIQDDQFNFHAALQQLV